MAKYKINRKTSSIISVVFGIITIISITLLILVITPRQKEKDWKQFQEHTDSFSPLNLKAIHSNKSTVGCFDGDRGPTDIHLKNCYFYNYKFYLITDGVKANAEQILDYFYAQGYSSSSKTDRFISLLKNSKKGDAFERDTTGTIMLINKKTDVEVSLSIGDKLSSNKHSSFWAPADKIETISEKDMLLGMHFSKINR